MWCCRQGASGSLDGASKQMLEDEFGTKSEEDAIKMLLEKGEVQAKEVSHHAIPEKKHDTCGIAWLMARSD